MTAERPPLPASAVAEGWTREERAAREAMVRELVAALGALLSVACCDSDGDAEDRAEFGRMMGLAKAALAKAKAKGEGN